MRLLLDRFAVHGDRACDLVSGDEVRLAEAEAFADTGDETGIATLVELFDQGPDGMPRWIVADVRNGAQAAAVMRRTACAARRHGFVAMAVSAYHRFHRLLAEDLVDRALLLVGGFGARPADAQSALLSAAAGSARPHILLTFRLSSDRVAPCAVREARAIYGLPAARVPRPAMPADVLAHLRRAERAREFVAAGRHAAAERLLRDVAGALERRRATAEAAGVALALIDLLLRRGRLDAADAACHEILRLATMSGDATTIARARIADATIRLERMRLVEAESISRAVMLAASDDSCRLKAALVLARCLLAQGRIEEAATLRLPPEDAAGWEPGELADVHDAITTIALAAGRPFDAGQAAGLAMAAAEQLEPGIAAKGERSHGAELELGLGTEARVVGYMARLRVLCAAGDIEGARAQWLQLRQCSSRMPLREAAARIVWCQALQRAGRGQEARIEETRLARMRRAATPLLKQAIDAALTGRPVAATPPRPACTALAPDLVRVAHDEEEDAGAIRKVIERVASSLSTSRIDVVSAAAGPVTVAISVGFGLATTLGGRVMEAGIAIGVHAGGAEHSAGHEAAMPVRRGAHLLGALVCRWPIDRTAPPHAHGLLELAAAVIGPRLDAMQGRAREIATASTMVPELVGSSGAIEEVRQAIARAARAPFAVLIEGESGTGKELVARAIHQLGPRRERRFCDVNCAALPDDLLESELFGHARGAFTGALVDRAGLFEDASGGTLFMDEVADLSARAQAKLLRVVQQQELRRVGETITRTIDVRIVAAANRDLQAEADAGRFRHDLLYRLNVIRIRIPPLHERAADVPALALHFWREAAARVGSRASLAPAVLAALARYHWPGNVRELQNVIAALAVAAPPAGRISPGLLPPVIGSNAASPSQRLAEARDQFERRFVEVALARAGGSRTRAAAALGLTRQGLLKTIARLGVGA